MSLGKTVRIAYVYLHGFAGSAMSKKGLALRETIPQMILPDLNPPNFCDFTVSSALERMDELHREETEKLRLRFGTSAALKWRIVGSSLGGYVAAKWAEANEESVDRMVLYCPALDLRRLWIDKLGREEIETWKRTDAFALPGPGGATVQMPFRFLKDVLDRHDAVPDLSHETLILHGTKDEVVPFERSKSLVRALEKMRNGSPLNGRPDVSLMPIHHADHSLHDEIPTLLFNTLKFLGNIEHKPLVSEVAAPLR